MQAHRIPFHRSKRQPSNMNQDRGHGKSDAAEDHNGKIDEKKRSDGEETKRGSPMSLVDPIKGDAERAESANEKFGVLKNIVMHRYPDQFVGPSLPYVQKPGRTTRSERSLTTQKSRR